MPKLDIRITALQPPGSQGGIRAHVSMTIDDCFGVRGIKIVEGGKKWPVCRHAKPKNGKHL